LLLAAGVNVKAVSARLGHAGVQITLDTYTHVLPQMEEGAIAALDAAISPKSPPELPHGPTDAEFPRTLRIGTAI